MLVTVGLGLLVVVGDALVVVVAVLLCVLVSLLEAEVEDGLGLAVGELIVPPWTLNGTLPPSAFDAADLNASNVSEPELLVGH